MKTLKVLLATFILFSYGNILGQQNQVLKVESNHLSIDLNVFDKTDIYYLEIVNNSNSDMEISVVIQVNTKCGKTINYSKKEQIQAHKKTTDGGFSGTIEKTANCKGGLESAVLISMSATDLTQESFEQASKKNNATTDNSSNANLNSNNTSNSINKPYSHNNKEITEMVERQNRINVLQQKQQQAQKEAIQSYVAQQEESKRNAVVYQEQSDALFNGVLEVVNMFEEDARRKKEKEAREQERLRIKEQNENFEKAMFEANINNRKSIIAEFPHKDIPLSSVEKSTKIYYFIYAYDINTIEQSNITIYVSNVFEIGKYGDGTWPYMITIKKETATLTTFDEVFHGYYYSFEDAETMRQSFVDLLGNNKGVSITKISYEGKPFAGNPISGNDSVIADKIKYGKIISLDNKDKNNQNLVPVLLQGLVPSENPRASIEKNQVKESKYGKTIKLD